MGQEPPPYDLDDRYNRFSAWWGEPTEVFPSGWRASFHGCGDEQAMKRCGCPPCLDTVEIIRESYRQASLMAKPPKPPPPKTMEVGPVAAHVRRLLEGGMSRRELARRAGLDVTTVCRILRADVKRVSLDTADAVLAVPVRLHAVG